MSEKSMAVRLVTRFRGNKGLSSLMSATGHSLKNKKWVFILGCYNSGTTLLDQILSSHPQFSGLHEEGVMLTDKLSRPEDFGWRRMWCKCEKEMMVPIGAESEASEKIKKHWSHFYDSKKQFLIEKSISNTPRALFFEHHFQPAYFVHIVRNGYAVSEGIRRKAEVMRSPGQELPKEYPIEWCAHQWKRSLEVIDQLRPGIKNIIDISYEELTSEPDLTMKKICDFIGAPHFKQSLSEVSFDVHKLKEQIVNMNARSIKNLRAEQISAINGVAEASLKRYGYFMTR